MAQKIASERGEDLLLHNKNTGQALAGKLHNDFMSEIGNNLNTDLKNPDISNFTSSFLQKEKPSDINKQFELYMNTDDKHTLDNLKNAIGTKLKEKIDKIQNQTDNVNQKLSQHKYNLDKINGENDTDFDTYMKNAKNSEKTMQFNKEYDTTNKLHSMFTSVDQTGQQAIQALSNLKYTDQKLIEGNYKNINKIDENILKTSERIDKLKSRHKFNNLVIQKLRTALLVIFILMMCMIGYYGVRDNYIPIPGINNKKKIN